MFRARSKNRWLVRLAAAGLLGMTAVTVVLKVPQSSHAAENLPRVEIIHRPPDGATIAGTATWMPLTVELKNTREVGLKVRLVGSRDGRFVDIALPQGILNDSDLPTYKIEIPAPAAALSYQFIVHQPDGTLSTSKRFVIKRPCVQTFKVEVTGNDTDAAFRKQVGELVAKAKMLERETANYDAALKILDELKTNIPE